MFLTHEILEKYEACAEGIEFFDRHFPNGAELSEVVQMRHIPHSFLHWGWLYLTTTEEERALYNKILGNVNSIGLYQSEKIINSNYVSSSKDVVDSQWIQNGEKIKESSYIVDSGNIQQSSYVSQSTNVFNSIGVFGSTNIKESQMVMKSSLVIKSASVVESSMVSDSTVIYDSTNVNDSLFVCKGRGVLHCLFCYDVSGQEYLLFNKPINKTHFDFIMEEYKMFELPNITLVENMEENWNSGITPSFNRQKHFKAICSDDHFIKWVKSLPNYSSDIFYNITFSERAFD